MVTHDVDEAILLSDRVLVMSKSPEANHHRRYSSESSPPPTRAE
ncbi:hypothetical protein CgS9114_01484 [Corynebacterium glutamicum S9114]|nr:hypothetical protein CgS9114_01484 [Corynebacterium glutamicum S9114]